MSFLNFVQGLVKTRWKSLKGFDQSHHVLLLCRNLDNSATMLATSRGSDSGCHTHS